jgi:glucuronoarabinoxylan endo-1,4-beta-xylanase
MGQRARPRSRKSPRRAARRSGQLPTVWATPWSPAAAFKTNNNVVGGRLSDGKGWASSLAKFVQNMKASGVNIFAVSAENEPDANVTYESCSYTPTELASFIGTYLGPALAGTGAKVLGPESQNWCGFQGYADAIMNDTRAASYTSIIATHEYGCSPFSYPRAPQSGKEFWQTEIYDTASTADPGMGSGLRVAKLIYDALTIANVNAWHYWWVYPLSNDNGALWDKSTGQASKRLYVMGNFSRFVRPGFNRIDVSGSVPSGVSVAAFTNPSDRTLAIVAINTNTSATSLNLSVSGSAWPAQVTPWVTSSSASLASQTAIPLSGAKFSASLPAQSVTTFSGR